MNAPREPGSGASVRILGALALVLASGSLLFEGVIRPAGGGFKGYVDFAPYYRGAVALVRGLDPYDLATTDAIGKELGVTEAEGFRYLYPPVFALLASPLAALPYPAAKAVWCALNVALLLGTIFLLPGAVVPNPQPAERRLVLFLAAAFLPVLETLRLGQANLIPLFLAVFALHALGRGRPVSAGFAVGLASATKVTPAALLGLFLFRRQWRAFLSGGASAAALLVLGFAVCPSESFGSFRGHVLTWYARGHASVSNQSPQGFFLRALTGAASPQSPDPSDPATQTAAALARVVALAVLATVGLVLLRKRRATLAEEFGLVLSTLPLVSAITWVHHLVLLLPAFAAVFLGLVREGTPPRGKAALAIVAYALVALPLGYDHPAMRVPALLPLVSTKLAGTLILFGILLRDVAAGSRDVSGGP